MLVTLAGIVMLVKLDIRKALSGIVVRQDYPPQLMDRKEQLRTLSNR